MRDPIVALLDGIVAVLKCGLDRMERFMMRAVAAALEEAAKGDLRLARKLLKIYYKRPDVWNVRMRWRDVQALKRVVAEADSKSGQASHGAR